MKDEELIAAAPFMWANRELWEVDDEMSAFTRRFVKELFEETRLALAEGRFKAAEEALKKLEAAPAVDLAQRGERGGTASAC